MSSFASQPLTFAPYIPSIDPETYVKVGMQKQGQYDQGVQKIQSTIDNVGGLDILHPEAQQYYKQQYEGVKNKINQLASSDFSNASVVNQVGGIASSLAKDPGIQNAVMSTVQIRALQKSQQEKKQKGDYTPQMEWYDNTQVEDYTKNPDWKNNPYKGPTTASSYHDYDKVIREQLKELDPEVSYETDLNGKIQLSTIKSSIVSPNKIKEIVEGVISTSPQALFSSQVDAAYLYKDYSKQQLQTLKDAYSKDISKQYDEVIAINEKNRAANPNNTDEQTRITNASKEYTLQKQNTIAAIQSAKDDDFKYTFFKNQLINKEILNYSKNDREEVETTTGKHWVEYLKAGLNPITGEIIEPDSPYYAISQHVKTSTGALTDYGKGYTSQTSIGEPTTQNDLQEVIKGYDQRIQNVKNNIKSDNDLHTEEEWSIFETQQKDILEHKGGVGVDKGYLLYLQQSEEARIRKAQAQTEIDNATIAAENAHPYNETDKIVVGLTDKETNTLPLPNQLYSGHSKHSVTIDPHKNIDFIKKLYTISEEVDNKIQKDYDTHNAQLDASVAFGGGITKAMMSLAHTSPQGFYRNDEHSMGVINTVLSKYKNDPNYNLYKEVLISGQSRNILSKYESVAKKRSAFIDDQLKERSKSHTNTTFDIPVEMQNKSAQTILSMISEGGTVDGKTETPSLPDLKKITPLQIGATENGQMFYTYSEEGTGEQHTVVGKVDRSPYDYIKNLNAFNYLVSSSEANDGKNVIPMYSPQGKIQYGWYKSKATGSWTPRILLPGGKYVNVTRHEFVNRTNPREIQLSMEQLEGKINQQTNQPFTREEIIQFLTSE